MLSRSFVFLPGIGPKRERALWEAGVHTWDDYTGAARVKGVSERLRGQHASVLSVARRALPRDPSFFARVLPSPHHWRAFGDLGEGAAYVDIETTGGLGGNCVTVVGVHLRGRTRLLVRGRDLSREAVEEALADATMLVTFNGSTFDLPMLASAGARIPQVPHLDLRHALRHLGYRGGLKAIERALGMARDEDLEGVSGFDAIVLWHRHELGDATALDQLLRYNQADVENMVPLARLAYDGLRARTLEDLPAAPKLDRFTHT